MFKTWVGCSEKNYFFTKYVVSLRSPLSHVAVGAKSSHEFYNWLVQLMEEKSVKGY